MQLQLLPQAVHASTGSYIGYKNHKQSNDRGWPFSFKGRGRIEAKRVGSTGSSYTGRERMRREDQRGVLFILISRAVKKKEKKSNVLGGFKERKEVGFQLRKRRNTERLEKGEKA